MITLDGIELPQDLEWQDEFDWTPVAQDAERSLSGKLVVEESAMTLGRPITLFGGEGACWVPRSLIVSLQALKVAGQVMTLDYHGTTYSVMWRHGDRPLEAKPVVRIRNPGDDHKYILTLRLMEVSGE